MSRREIMFDIRISQEEQERFASVAEALGLSLADMLRLLVKRESVSLGLEQIRPMIEQDAPDVPPTPARDGRSRKPVARADVRWAARQDYKLPPKSGQGVTRSRRPARD